jgi:tetratricopeptide (TPR) repeat protein
MLHRLFVLIIIAGQVLFFVSGCEQIKDYRKRAYYEKGLELYEAQQYNEALDQFNFALAFDEDYVDARALLGMCLYELKNYESAGDAFLEAVLVDDSRDDLRLKASDSFFLAGKPKRAKYNADAVLDKDPGNVHARYRAARIRILGRWKWEEADGMLQPLLDEKEYRAQAFALLAVFHIYNDDLEQAELILAEHANANEDWFFGMRKLAKEYFDLNDQQAAVRICRKIVELQPGSTQDLEQLLALLRRFGWKEDERRLLVSLIAADEQQIRYKLGLIDFYVHYEQYAEAEEFIRACLEQGAGYFDFSRCLIDVYEKTNRYKEAIQCAKDVLGKIEKGEALDRQLEFMNILARLYYVSNNREMAKAVVRWILDIDRESHPARFLSARISLDEGRTLLAISEFRGLGSEDTENPDYDYYIGLAHLARDENGIAELSFKECLKKQPNYKPALFKISEILFEKESFDELKRMTDEFLTISPNDPDVLALQAEIASKMDVIDGGA